jgi:hypothetical protein
MVINNGGVAVVHIPVIEGLDPSSVVVPRRW